MNSGAGGGTGVMINWPDGPSISTGGGDGLPAADDDDDLYS